MYISTFNKQSLKIFCFLLLTIVPLFSKTLVVPSNEFATISSALVVAKANDTVSVRPGKYKEQITIPPAVILVSSELFKAIIHGRGNEHVVTLGNGSTIRGFVVTGGKTGIYAPTTGGIISQCMVRNNSQTGISCVGRIPTLEDNIICNNGGSGIQVWDAISSSGTINHNTIAFNENHGIAIGGKSNITIENNIVSNNLKFGFKADEDSKVKLANNSFYMNGNFYLPLPANNFVYAPQYLNPKSYNYMLSEDSECNRRGSNGKNLGTRIIY